MGEAKNIYFTCLNSLFFKMAPPKKKVVKHLKKNWKKHSDIQDVEDFLEEKRQEERTGGIVAEKKDDQLFFLDAAPEDDAKKTATSGQLSSAPPDQGKKRKIDEPARCYANLQPDPRVPLANTIQEGEKGKKRKRALAAKRRQTDPRIIKRLRTSQKQHAINAKQKAAQKLADEEGAPVVKDLWASDDENQVKDDNSEDEDDPIAFHNKITKVMRVAVPNSRNAMKRGASSFPAVPMPHPGASYNPDLGQYLDHLRAAHQVEEAKEKEADKLVRELDAKFPDQAEAKKLASNWLIEMSGGLAEKEVGEEEGEEKEEKVEEEGEEGVSTKKEKRKTKKQRRKAKEQRSIQQKLAKKKTAKQRSHEFDQLKMIDKEITAREQELKEKLSKKALLRKKQEKAGVIRRIGQNKYEAMDVEVKLSSELVGDLRSLVPEGNLLEDRYDNLKRRNLVAPGVRQKKGQRKFKLKKQEKRAWRGITLEDVDVPIASV